MKGGDRRASHVPNPQRPRRLAAAAGLGVAVFLIAWSISSPGRDRPAMPHKGKATVLKNKAGVEVHVLSTGAIIQRLLVPDKDGQWAENPSRALAWL